MSGENGALRERILRLEERLSRLDPLVPFCPRYAVYFHVSNQLGAATSHSNCICRGNSIKAAADYAENAVRTRNPMHAPASEEDFTWSIVDSERDNPVVLTRAGYLAMRAW